jgi:hypothetical protein
LKKEWQKIDTVTTYDTLLTLSYYYLSLKYLLLIYISLLCSVRGVVTTPSAPSFTLFFDNMNVYLSWLRVTSCTEYMHTCIVSWK